MMVHKDIAEEIEVMDLMMEELNSLVEKNRMTKKVVVGHYYSFEVLEKEDQTKIEDKVHHLQDQNSMVDWASYCC